jgi:glutamate 5-kinase
MRNGQTSAKFTLRSLKDQRTVEVLGENRTIISEDGVFGDNFEAWDVHLYRIGGKNALTKD